MTRLLEFIVALVIVAVVAVIVGVSLPSSGHIERTLVVSKDIRHVYDMLDNFRRFPEYAVLGAWDPEMKYQQSQDDWYGPGASISWTSDDPKVGNGTLTIVSDEPGFDEVQQAGQATIVWSVDNDWRGENKLFTIHLERTGRSQKLIDITWAYDVDYGWNLFNRYSGLYLHGNPDSLIQYSLDNLQNVLASVPNIGYEDLMPKIVERPQKPVLFVSTTAKRNLTDVGAATDAAMAQLQAAMKELGVHQAGPRVTFTTNYGNESYDFDVAVPIDTSTLSIDDKDYDLTVPLSAKQADAAAAAAASAAEAASAANATSVAGAASAAGAGSVAGATSTEAADEAKPVGPQPGTRDKYGHLVVDANVRGMLAFGGRALQGQWIGSPAGIPPTRLRLKAYAATHGYGFDPLAHRAYDVQVVAYNSMGPDGKPLAYDQQTFKVYLPLSSAPQQTPEQAAGMEPVNPFPYGPGAASSAPAPAGSAPASAASVTAPSVANSAP